MSEDYKVQYSIKVGPADPRSGSGNDMVNIRANDATELDTLMMDMVERAALLGGYADQIRASIAVVEEFPETVPFSGGTPAAPATTAYPPGTKVCAHGVPMEWKQGVSKAGKAYKGWYCTRKNDPNLPECKPEWVN